MFVCSFKMISDKPTHFNFDKDNYAWKSDIDYRRYPEKYKVGKVKTLAFQKYRNCQSKFRNDLLYY